MTPVAYDYFCTHCGTSSRMTSQEALTHMVGHGQSSEVEPIMIARMPEKEKHDD